MIKWGIKYNGDVSLNGLDELIKPYISKETVILFDTNQFMQYHKILHEQDSSERYIETPEYKDFEIVILHKL